MALESGKARSCNLVQLAESKGKHLRVWKAWTVYKLRDPERIENK
jgi:hypothetical protein